jgi:hypothetical protein
MLNMHLLLLPQSYASAPLPILIVPDLSLSQLQLASPIYLIHKQDFCIPEPEPEPSLHPHAVPLVLQGSLLLPTERATNLC